MVRPGRLELPTPAMSRQYSNQLSYGRITLLSFDNVVSKEKLGASRQTRTADPCHVKAVL